MSVDQVINNIFKIRNKLLANSSCLYADEDISITELILLKHIDKVPDISLKQLSEILGVSSSAVTQTLNKLVKKGYITREENKEDRRFLKIHLTTSSRNKFKRLNEKSHLELKSYFAKLNAKELEQLNQILEKLVN